MTDETGFRIRLRVRIAKALTTDATSLSVEVANKGVSITSQNKSEPLNKAKWVVLHARDFKTEDEAQRFGDRLCSIVQLAALASRLGADIGQNKPSGWMSEDFARSSGIIKAHERIAPNVHGLSILPDDDYTRIPIINIEGIVTASPEHLMSAIEELGNSSSLAFGPASNGVRLLNLALMTSEPLAQMVLAFSAVEEVGQNEQWTEAQTAVIKQLAEAAETHKQLTEDERLEVARAIRSGLFPLSLRQGVIRVLTALGLDHLRKEWDRLYGIRSGVFHGTARPSDSELHQAAMETLTLCGQIILAIVAKEGTNVPSIAATHFSKST